MVFADIGRNALATAAVPKADSTAIPVAERDPGRSRIVGKPTMNS
jgi:hypothetical protein